MKKTNVQTITKHLIAIVLCAALSVAYFPMSGTGDGKAYAAVSWIDQVESIQFVSVDPSNYEFYDGADNMQVDDEDYNEDDYFFYDGDRIIATLNNNSTITITYYEDEEGENCWWEDEDGNKLAQSQEPVILQNPRLINITTPRTFYLTISFAGKTTTQTAKMLASPIQSISFTPNGTEEEIAARFTMTQGDEFIFSFEKGDKLTATINGVTKTYTARWEYDNEFDESYIEFYDSNNNEIPYEYGWVDYESFDSTSWSVGTHNIYVTYGKARTAVPVKVVANLYNYFKYEPVKTSYTEAELILLEYYDDEAEDGLPYYCGLEPLAGDKLTLRSTDSSTYKRYTFDGESFKDTQGEVLDDEWTYPELYHEGSTSCAQAGTYTFTAEYALLKSNFTINVTPSSQGDKDAAIELRDARDTATDRIEELFDSKNPEEYREAQWDQIYDAYNNAMDAAQSAATPDEARSIAAAFENTLKQIKTDAQMSADEEAARRAAAAPAQAAPAEIQDLPAVKISKPKAAKKKVTVKWKKVNKKNLKKIQGIEIRVAGPGVDKVVTAGKKKTSKKVGGLQSKQKYTVQVRAYAWIGGVKHVSAWKTKSVKVK